jgi:hypothetical protein
VASVFLPEAASPRAEQPPHHRPHSPRQVPANIGTFAPASAWASRES